MFSIYKLNKYWHRVFLINIARFRLQKKKLYRCTTRLVLKQNNKINIISYSFYRLANKPIPYTFTHTVIYFLQFVHTHIHTHNNSTNMRPINFAFIASRAIKKTT